MSARAASKKKLSFSSVFIDGASRGNPGPASVGVAFVNDKNEIVHSLSKRIGITTNNIAEYSALILALQSALILGAKELTIYTDSELLARQFSGQYKVKEDTLKVLFLFVMNLREGFTKLAVNHVPREQNKMADKLANQALDESFLV